MCSPTPFHLLLQYTCLYLLAYRMIRKIGFNSIANSAGNTTSRGLLKAVQSTRPVLFGTPKKLHLEENDLPFVDAPDGQPGH